MFYRNWYPQLRITTKTIVVQNFIDLIHFSFQASLKQFCELNQGFNKISVIYLTPKFCIHLEHNSTVDTNLLVDNPRKIFIHVFTVCSYFPTPKLWPKFPRKSLLFLNLDTGISTIDFREYIVHCLATANIRSFCSVQGLHSTKFNTNVLDLQCA